MKRNTINNLEHLKKILCDENNRFYLYGTGKTGENFYQQMNGLIKITGFIESEPTDKQKLGLPVYKWGDPELKLAKNDKIIITVQTAIYRNEVETRLLQDSLTKNQDFIFYDVARRIISFYIDNIFWLSQIDLTITTACTLNCRDCIQQIPLIKNRKHLDLQEIIENLNLTFNYIDFCEEFHIVGGEPLLHPQLPEILNYLGTHYRTNIGTIVIVSNGTIIPKEDLLNALEYWNVRLEMSDYRNSTAIISNQKIDELEILLKQYHISYLLRPMTEWNDYCGDCNKASDSVPTGEALISTFDICPCAGQTLSIQGQKAYICSRSSVAEAFGLIDENPENGILLSSDSTETKERLLEFSVQITEKGYIPYCINCYSKKPIYERIIPAALQTERII